jgi:hypothetical protein
MNKLNVPSENEINDAVEIMAKQSTAPDADTPDWIKSDIKKGIRWAIKYFENQIWEPHGSVGL